MLLQTLTTAPILLAIHLKFSRGVPLTDMSRASLSYLILQPPNPATCPGGFADANCPRVPNEQGRSLLWIHLLLMIYITASWIYALWWIGRGSVQIRRRLVEVQRDKTLRRIRRERKRELRAAKKQERRLVAADMDRSKLGKAPVDGLPTSSSECDHKQFGEDGLVQAAAHHSVLASMKEEQSKRSSAEGILSDDDDDDDVEGSAGASDGEDTTEEDGLVDQQAGMAGAAAATASKKRKTDKKPRAKFDPSAAGWRQRTLIVTNMPSTMRDEASVRRYFEEFLRPDDDDQQSAGAASMASLLREEEERRKGAPGTKGVGPLERKQAHEIGTIRPGDLKGHSHLQQDTYADGEPFSNAPAGKDMHGAEPAIGPEPDVHQPFRHLQSPVQTVVLVRKMTELSSMLQRRQEVLGQLEAAHMKLARNVLQGLQKGGPSKKAKDKRKAKKEKQHAAANGSTASVDKTDAASEDAAENVWTDEEALAELKRRLGRFLPRKEKAQEKTEEELAAEMEAGDEETIWEALLKCPRELLDPYQPVTRLSALFRGQTVPTIDYLLTKLNLLTALVTEMRARPPSSYEPTSTAFVTFRDPRQARMVWRELDSQIVIKVRPAPEVKDLDWDRLMRTTFTGDIVRGLGVNAFFWGFTIFWTLVIQIVVTTLFSVTSLKFVFGPIASFFANNEQFEGFITVTVPSLIITLVTMLIPELVFQISKRAQGFVTFSALYDQCLCRYWKFVICNVVIFFCIGTATVRAILTQIGSPIGSRLDAVAFAFPVAAPFFVSYFILCMGTHSGMDLLQAIIGLVQHVGARNAFTPRARAIKSLPRNFNRYYWLPFHILMIVIVFIFAVLNPLVIPFAMLYLFCAL